MIVIKEKDSIWIKLLRIVFWLVIWQLIMVLVSGKICFAGPYETAKRLLELLKTKDFYLAVFFTFTGIAGGYGVGMIVGTVLGYNAHFHPKFDYYVTPVIDFFRYIPMVTVTLVALLWAELGIIAFEVSVFLSLPVIYKHTVDGLKKANQHYLKRARQLKFNPIRKLVYIYQPLKVPGYVPGCHKAMNMCWKSGILAQLITDKGVSIGTMLAAARDERDIAAIFAFTIVIVCCSISFEKIVFGVMSLDILNAGKIDVAQFFKDIDNDDIML